MQCTGMKPEFTLIDNNGTIHFTVDWDIGRVGRRKAVRVEGNELGIMLEAQSA